MKQSTFYVAKMDCPTEEQIIRNRFKAISEIEALDFNLMQRELTITHRLDDEKSLLSALDALGMEPQLKSAGANHEDGAARDDREHPAAISTATRVLMGISGLAALAAEAVAWTMQNETSWPVITLALLSIAAGGRDTLRKGIVALKTFTLNINFLMTLAVVGAVCIGQWPEAAMVTFLFGVAEMIEALSLERARNAIRGLMEMTPETATTQDKSGAWREVEAAAVQVGQVVRVKPGERIPLDGVLQSGASTVNQAPITGESMPVEKKAGDQVFAGSVNERGAFEFTVTANKGHTTLARIIRAVQEAQGQRAPTQRFVDNFARYYTPAVVVLAILVATVPPLFFGVAFSPWLYKALVMLVIACPCALVISTPVTVVSGLASAARQGVLIKGGVYLEEGRKLKVIALDKTGTLTHGKPQVTDVIALTPAPSPNFGRGVPERSEGGVRAEDALLQLAASLDAPSEHPVASAIVAAWTGRHEIGKADGAVEKSGELLKIENFHSITGRGVQGEIGGQRYFVGNHRLAEENGVCGPHVEAVLDRLEAEGKTTVVLSTDQESLAVLGVADTLRETSIEAVKQMHDLGVRTVMLTGDNQKTACAIASKANIDAARGDLLPDDKLRAIDELLQEHGHVGMVGDGINDAPALAKSSIGFAMGAAGTDTAIETADVALMQDDLRKLPLFLKLSRKTSQVLAQNITLAIGIKLIFFVLALTGHATLWMAVFADMGASLLVVLNGLRLLRSPTAAVRPAVASPPVGA
ncbi:MAG TPA: heavy metal translocating P-type ATPase [Abditibacteriaceae bacterium]|nr:heavy metal translocating P-type ATPase [Abditibacteriaceae bacterium]